MKYRVTCLSPTLVGDGQKLSPIDYMVWRDHVNVLDQRRIFKLLARNQSRLDGYLAQLKKADKLDFASWGGFAQNFAGRRIPLEHASLMAHFERARPENLFIPTFAANTGGAYLPGTAVKGALRTGALSARLSEAAMRELAKRLEGDRLPRRLGERVEDQLLGGSGSNKMRAVSTADSGVVPYSAMKVYMLRTSTLAARGPKLELAWKTSPRGTVARADDATPVFVEMATPGTAFDGQWNESNPDSRRSIFRAANQYAAAILDRHLHYAETTGLKALEANLRALSERSRTSDACLLAIGWGGGLLGKSAYVNSEDTSYREILRQIPPFERAIQSGLPFPKTRRIIFEAGQPASLPGWVLLEVG
ncbi:MAG: type III-A CRISPR-associated RAMP protein Csm5 [Bryobacteraceae bacterium]